MRMLDPDKLKVWEEYREYLKESLKLLEGEGPCYVSKSKFEFEINGNPWLGQVILAGKNADKLARSLKPLAFKKGSCSLQSKDLVITELEPPKLIKDAAKTLVKLNLGYRILFQDDEAAGPDLDERPTAGAAAAPEARRTKVDELRKLGADIERLLTVLNK